MSELTIDDTRMRDILIAVKSNGRLVYLPTGSCYRAAGTQVDVTSREVSVLLKQNLIQPVNGSGGPYMLTTAGLGRLAWLNSERIDSLFGGGGVA